MPRTRDTSPLVSVRAASRLRHALPGLPAFFCPLCAVYIRPHTLFHAYTVLCTPHRQRGVAMTFEEILDQAIAILQRRVRLTYGTLKRQFQLDDATLEDLKNELIAGQRLAIDEGGNV